MPGCEKDRNNKDTSACESSMTSNEWRFPDPAMPKASIGMPEQAPLRMEMQKPRFVLSEAVIVKPVFPETCENRKKPKEAHPTADRKRSEDTNFKVNNRKSR